MDELQLLGVLSGIRYSEGFIHPNSVGAICSIQRRGMVFEFAFGTGEQRTLQN